MFHQYGIIDGRIFDRYRQKFLNIAGMRVELKVKCRELNRGVKQQRRNNVIGKLVKARKLI